jgi:hypothetical protein
VPGCIDYVNLPRTIGAVVSSRMASLIELQTVYGVTDLYRMLEVLTVDAHNRRVLSKPGRE